jgi:hypothetical protein
MAGARCESGRHNHQCNQTSHGSVREELAAGVRSEKAPPTGERATGLSNRGGETRYSPRVFTSQTSVSELGRQGDRMETAQLRISAI